MIKNQDVHQSRHLKHARQNSPTANMAGTTGSWTVDAASVVEPNLSKSASESFCIYVRRIPGR